MQRGLSFPFERNSEWLEDTIYSRDAYLKIELAPNSTQERPSIMMGVYLQLLWYGQHQLIREIRHIWMPLFW